MLLRKFTFLVFVIHLLVGSFCIIPIASAMEAVSPHQEEEMEQVTEMVMTPINAMSPLDCTGCVTITRPKHHMPVASDIPCNDDHCLLIHEEVLPVTTQLSQKEITKAMTPLVAFSIETPDIRKVGFAPQIKPAKKEFSVQTVVLRE